MRATETDQPFSAGLPGGRQMVFQFEPLVATDQRVDQVEAQDGDVDAGCTEPVEIEALQRGGREHGNR